MPGPARKLISGISERSSIAFMITITRVAGTSLTVAGATCSVGSGVAVTSACGSAVMAMKAGLVGNGRVVVEGAICIFGRKVGVTVAACSRAMLADTPSATKPTVTTNPINKGIAVISWCRPGIAGREVPLRADSFEITTSIFCGNSNSSVSINSTAPFGSGGVDRMLGTPADSSGYFWTIRFRAMAISPAVS